MDEIDLGVITQSLKYSSNLWIIFNVTEQFDLLVVLNNCKGLQPIIEIVHVLETLREKNKDLD
jgi:hypothetical protein